jgi:hypothetical protein
VAGGYGGDYAGFSTVIIGTDGVQLYNCHAILASGHCGVLHDRDSTERLHVGLLAARRPGRDLPTIRHLDHATVDGALVAQVTMSVTVACRT